MMDMTVRDVAELNLPDGFEFGVVETDEEVEELIAFNAHIHEDTSAEVLERWLEHLPGFSPEMNYYIRDSSTGKIVSSVNAIPSIWNYDGVHLRNLELGYVGTEPEYRKKGLIRVLYTYFERELQNGEYDISTIQGIPYFYRHAFGYDFIIPLNRGVTLHNAQLPQLKEEDSPDFMSITVREANEQDMDAIETLYQELLQRFLVTGHRSKELWRTQENIKMEIGTPYRTMILEKDGIIDGYFKIVFRKYDSLFPYGDCAEILESSIRSIDSVMRALYYAKEATIEKNCHYFATHSALESNLCKIVLNYGGRMWSGWKYMVRIPNVVRFLRTIQPVLEERIKGTMFEGLSRDIFLNTYRNCYHLEFVNGKIKSIKDIGMQDIYEKTEIRIPSKGLVRLILGANTIDELNKMDIDFIVRGWYRNLLEVLFPKKESYVFPYQC